MYPLYSLPAAFEEQLEKRLLVLSYSLKKPKPLAESIRKLSNIFLKGNISDDYWRDKKLRAAYTAYFAILNFIRAQAVFAEARKRNFLRNAEIVADWGCGAGSATWALHMEIPESRHFAFLGIDQNAKAIDEYNEWSRFLDIKASTKIMALSDLKNMRADTLVMSYVLNEVKEWPKIPESVKRIVIIEPSTHQAGRELLTWRDARIDEGWYAWAPCTHQNHCPLLAHSGKDWCHHRVHWSKPDWFLDLEKFLPMRNDTLTLSYLLLAREKPIENLAGSARVVGDEQEEKGKTRQMICRGPQREFLSWLHRDQISLKLKRGDVIKIGSVTESRANEIRVLDPATVEKLDVE